MDRRRAAILVTDMVGYSRLMELDGRGTLARLNILRESLIHPTIARHDGRIVKLMGDGTLVEFANPLDAVRCAISLQENLSQHDPDSPEDQRVVFRVGVNLDEVLIDGDDIYGDGVNVAARLEGMADPGGVLISQPVYDAVVDHLDAVFFDNGERKFKNISRRIRVWSWPRKLPSLRAQGKPRVFVADFEGRGSEEQGLGTDLGSELRVQLARLTGLEVTADPANAHYRVEGQVRLAGSRARIFARLTAIEDRRQVWSNRYDEETGDLFEIPDRCAPRITMSVRRRVAADDASLAASRSLDELSLEELLSLAGVSFFTPTKAGWRRGGEIAEQALALDPQNFMALAMAAAGLGLAEYLYGFRPPEEETIALAFKRINEALRLTNRSDMAHVTLACLQLFGRRRYREAAAAARRALEINPGYNMGLWMLGGTQVFAGEYDAGVESATRAVNIDPGDPYVHLYSRIVAYGHLGAGRFGDAADWFHRADQLAPGVTPNAVGLAASSWLDGDQQGAQHALESLMEEEPEFRISAALPPPYQDESIRSRLAETLRAAGAPE